jgi:hypothetical protein
MAFLISNEEKTQMKKKIHQRDKKNKKWDENKVYYRIRLGFFVKIT